MPKDQRVELFISLAASLELESDQLMQQTGNTPPVTAEQKKASATKAFQSAAKARVREASPRTKGRKGSRV